MPTSRSQRRARAGQVTAPLGGNMSDDNDSAEAAVHGAADSRPLYLREEAITEISQLAVSNNSNFVLPALAELMKYITNIGGDTASHGMDCDQAEMSMLKLLNLELMGKQQRLSIGKALERENQIVDPAVIFLTTIKEESNNIVNKTDQDKFKDNQSLQQFRKMIWDAKYGGDGNDDDEDAELPPVKDWFDAAGQILSITEIREKMREVNEDDDIVVAGEKRSLNCPVSLQLYEDPVTSTVCPHSFSKNAIMQLFLQGRHRINSIECPVAGCHQTLTRDNLASDGVLARRVERYKQRHAQQTDEREFDELG
ncbi:zinc-finger of the MIZ type in Nse subunit-domain-containing protein [Limtongia smithiae]|uniref:zinc-finger of the MIZ type in Nse subunit-domain-containing protein n=1 Tax=Limtongia smithiae TaxID=1125753 RepID=UPI0034CD2ECB